MSSSNDVNARRTCGFQGVRPASPQEFGGERAATRNRGRTGGFACGLLACVCLAALSARAGLSLDLQLTRESFEGVYYYGCVPELATNNTPPNPPFGTYRIESPNQPGSGFNRNYTFDSSGFHFTGGGGSLYEHFDEFIQNITTNKWSIRATTDTSTNLYYFAVTAGIVSNSLSRVAVTFPSEGATGVTNEPTFLWTGPAGWAGSLYVQDSYIDTNGDDVYLDGADLPPGETSWAIPTMLPEGTNRLFVQYSSNVTALVVAGTPTNVLGQPISSWTSTARLITYADSRFVVGAPPTGAGTAHTNIAHYTFEETDFLGQDSSTNFNHFNGQSSWGDPEHEPDAAAAAGAWAVRLYGVSSMTMTPPLEAFTNVTAVLADSFSLSLWMRTSDATGFDEDDAVDGATIVWLYNDQNNINDVIPIAVTGAKAAFSTRDDQGNTDTLHSTTDVNDDVYHHIVVTRDRSTGEKRIYVDGALEGTQVGTTNLLNGNDYYFSLGGTFISSYSGLVDDVQIYAGVLSAGEVAQLHSNPGTVIPDSNEGTSTNPPVDVEMEISVVRTREVTGQDTFQCYPTLRSVSLPEITQHRVESPYGDFSGSLSGAGSTTKLSLSDLIDACTGNPWRLYINEGDDSEQVYNFHVTFNGLDTNLLTGVTILSPANGSVGVSTQPAFTWSGPAGFSGAFVQTYQPPYVNTISTNMPGTPTNWPSPPTLSPGTNRFYVSCYSNDSPVVSFSTPVDAISAAPIHGWSATAHLNSDALSEFVVSALPAPVQLTSAALAGSNFEFQFQSEIGRTNTVQSRTNLLVGDWLDRTNIVGDGTIKTVDLPLGASPAEFFRVVTR